MESNMREKVREVKGAGIRQIAFQFGRVERVMLGINLKKAFSNLFSYYKTRFHVKTHLTSRLLQD